MNFCFVLLLNLVRSCFLLNSRANSCQRKVIKSLTLNLTLEPLTPNMQSRRIVLRRQCTVLHLLMWVHIALVSSDILPWSDADRHIMPLPTSRLSLATFSRSHLIIVHNQGLSLINQIVSSNRLPLETLELISWGSIGNLFFILGVGFNHVFCRWETDRLLNIVLLSMRWFNLLMRPPIGTWVIVRVPLEILILVIRRMQFLFLFFHIVAVVQMVLVISLIFILFWNQFQISISIRRSKSECTRHLISEIERV